MIALACTSCQHPAEAHSATGASVPVPGADACTGTHASGEECLCMGYRPVKPRPAPRVRVRNRKTLERLGWPLALAAYYGQCTFAPFNLDKLFKRVYSRHLVEGLLRKDHPFLARVRRESDFRREKGFALAGANEEEFLEIEPDPTDEVWTDGHGQVHRRPASAAKRRGA